MGLWVNLLLMTTSRCKNGVGLVFSETRLTGHRVSKGEKYERHTEKLDDSSGSAIAGNHGGDISDRGVVYHRVHRGGEWARGTLTQIQTHGAGS
jgi:hypothetical protein